MNNRFSMNGDGKGHVPNQSKLPHSPSNNHHEQQVIESLTQRYDEIEALWNEAEQDLNRFRIPHSVEHCYDSDYDHGYPTHYSLWWARYGKGWRIIHEVRTAFSEIDENRSNEGEWKPIIEWPLDVRLRMISEFEGLRRKVIEAAEKAVPKLDEAITNFRKVLKS